MTRSTTPPRKRPSKSPQGAARDAFRDELRMAAERVFAAKGFAATKMTDIAGEGRVGVGTLYNYFANKQEIFEEIFTRRSAEIEQLIDVAIEGKPPLEQIRLTLRVTLEYLEDHAALFALYMEIDHLGSEPEIDQIGGKVIEQRYARFLRKLEISVKAAVEAGELSREIPTWLLIAVLAGARNGAAYSWLKGSRERGLADASETILELFLSGARAPS